MSRKRQKPEQIANLPRKVEAEIANGKKPAQAAREAGICGQACYRWRKEFGGLKLGQVKRLKAAKNSLIAHLGGLELDLSRGAAAPSSQLPSVQS